MNEEIPADIMKQLETAQARFVDEEITLKDGRTVTATEAYLHDDDTGVWSVVVDFSDRTHMNYADLVAAVQCERVER